jgi:hypothetical protein
MHWPAPKTPKEELKVAAPSSEYSRERAPSATTLGPVAAMSRSSSAKGSA